MFCIRFSNLLHSLRSLRQGLHGFVEEGFNGAHVLGDWPSQGVEQGIEQPLDVIIYDGFHWSSADSDAVNLKNIE